MLIGDLWHGRLLVVCVASGFPAPRVCAVVYESLSDLQDEEATEILVCDV